MFWKKTGPITSLRPIAPHIMTFGPPQGFLSTPHTALHADAISLLDRPPCPHKNVSRLRRGCVPTAACASLFWSEPTVASPVNVLVQVLGLSKDTCLPARSLEGGAARCWGWYIVGVAHAAVELCQWLFETCPEDAFGQYGGLVFVWWHEANLVVVDQMWFWWPSRGAADDIWLKCER